MTLHVALNHKTLYEYDRRVQMGPQVIRLRPAAHSRTPVLSYALRIEPNGHFLNWQQDPHGNFLARVVFPSKVERFSVEVDLVADMAVRNPFDFFLEPEAEQFPFEYEPILRRDLEPYLAVDDEPGPLVLEWAKELSAQRPCGTVEFLVDVNQRLQREVAYTIRMEPGVQTPEQTLRLRSGSCRDTSWLLVTLLRRLGLAARFVSGYLIQLVADVKSLDGPTGADRDFTDLHAWCEVYLPGAGWVGLDPTSGLLAGEGHIPLACTPHPVSAAPITGALDEAETKFEHAMSVQRVVESPRVTKPYSEDQWRAVEAFGRRIERQLNDDDVRITIGGEPTFVAMDYPDAPEWNTAAVGPTKRAFASSLIERLRARFAPHGLLHYGQGKWYPGEQLPRWAFSLYWRRDGKPLWHEGRLIAAEKQDYGVTAEHARELLECVARRLDLDPALAVPAYEDPWPFIGQERKLPENLDAATNRLDDPLARARLARVFERGLSKPVGYVLPVQRWNAAASPTRRWSSEPWTTRAGKLFLVPGDSPLGFRLPLPSLTHIPPSDYPHVIPVDPFAPQDPLPDPHPRRQPFLRGELQAGGRGGTTQLTAPGRYARTALTVEPRDGRLCVFMPPVAELEDYLDLLAAIEDTCVELELPIHLEGYEPPRDSRLGYLKVTPDPGVIEVNVQPAAGWDEMRAITEGLYEDAHYTRLVTEKFMLDGRHTGTGGGNHVVLGGARAADSPFLRRPNLLRSLVTYWQHHPSLSYLFSGMFIGPTSQAPRIDEARHDSLHELELAFKQADQAQQPTPPWLVDRLFRNLLIDVTGNTHRSEICIDKLFSPDGPTGRLGLVEFRAFEMPPHPRMSLVQQLLLLALVARFWRAPYAHDLVRWGTQLHDKFMLPFHVWHDFCAVIDDMRSAGYELDATWFAPHFEFRFPLYGTVQFGAIELELRQALEPWHVLGEEGAVGGTVRYVDSSVERLQVKVRGMTDGRYAVACNGWRVPLTATGASGEFVGGVRYRAWQPAASLHPTIPVDSPLTFDLYDRWSRRAVAGCTYHVAHPGGRNFEHFPVNAYEAESRRLARFFPFGHTTRPYPEPRPLTRNDFPSTLDLRWSH